MGEGTWQPNFTQLPRTWLSLKPQHGVAGAESYAVQQLFLRIYGYGVRTAGSDLVGGRLCFPSVMTFCSRCMNAVQQPIHSKRSRGKAARLTQLINTESG